MAFDFIAEALQKRRSEHLLRQRSVVTLGDDGQLLSDGKSYLNFASNDYLGLAASSELKQALAEGAQRYGCGSGASPLVTGYSTAHQQLEQQLAGLLQREAVLLFNSGFAANMALTQALMSEGGTVIADKLSHASLLDGALASQGTLRRFAHNDVSHARRLLNQAQGNRLLVTEGIFSMDGDEGLVAPLAELAAQHQAWLMVDDAHGFGVLGEQGLGHAEQLSQGQLPVYMATLGKAVGCAGAFVAGSRQLIDFLVNNAREYIYSTLLPPAQAYAASCAIELLQRQRSRRQRLLENIALFRQLGMSAGLPLMNSASAIQPVLVGQPDKALKLVSSMAEQGIWLTAMRQPTVPKGTDRLRITLSAAHQPAQIKQLIDALQVSFEHVD